MCFITLKKEQNNFSKCSALLLPNFCTYFFTLKGNLENWNFTLERYSCINKNFWWSCFFLIRLGCREIWKMDQNEVTKLLSVGNIFLQATMHTRIFCICYAMTWIRPMVKSRSNMNKMAIILRPLMELMH